MKTNIESKSYPGFQEDLTASMGNRVLGQPAAISAIVLHVEMYAAGLAPVGRPAGVFLLLGPTGTGKTKTVEALADVLHGSERNLLRIDCGEFQMEHEVAKLIGAPPGYLGHRETHPMISQQKLIATTSEHCGLSLVLLDEIEKAAPSLGRLLLGVLDKAELHLGDNTTVNFESSLIFLTSNLGARDMFHLMNPDFGYGAIGGVREMNLGEKLARIGVNAVKRQFSPEFVNRIDEVITYQPLEAATLRAIVDQQIVELQAQIKLRLGARAFEIEVDDAGKAFLLEKGTNSKYGAREVKRTTHRHLLQPLAAMMVRGKIAAGETVKVSSERGGSQLHFETVPQKVARLAMIEGGFASTLPRARKRRRLQPNPAGYIDLSA